MNEGNKAGQWRTVPASKRGQVFSSGDVVDGDIEEAVVKGCVVEEDSGDMIEGCRVDTDKQSNRESGRENNVYNIDVGKAAGQYSRQDECNNDKTNINREYSGNNRRGDMGDQREVGEYQGHISFDSVARRETHELANDREAESDIRRVVTRGVGQSGRARMREMGSWFRDARSRQALDRVRSKHGSLRMFLQKEQKLLVYTDQQDDWCIRMREYTGRVGMEQQGITRKGLLRRRTHVMLRQWQGAILDEICQVKRSGYDSGSRWSSCSLWISRAIAKTMEERLRQNDRTLNCWFHDHPWTKFLVGANSAATVLRAPMRHQLSRSFQSAIQMFTEDRGSSIR